MKAMLHKYLSLDDKALNDAIASTNTRVVNLQRMKAHKTPEGKQALSILQSSLAAMQREAKRRKVAASRIKHNGA